MPDATFTPRAPVTSHRVTRAILAWLMQGLATVTVAGAGFFATPFLLRYLGREAFGAWEATSQWMAQVGLATLAAHATLTVVLLRARQLGPAEFAAARRLALRKLTQLAFLTLPVLALLVWFIPRLVPIQPALRTPLQMATVILGLGTLLVLPAEAFRIEFEVEQRSYWSRAALLIQSLGITGFSVWWARQWGLQGVAAGTVAGLLLGAGICWWLSKPGPKRITVAPPTTNTELWAQMWPFLLSGARYQINGMSDGLLIGLLLGPVAVAVLYLTQTLIYFVGRQINEIANVSWAAMAELTAEGLTAVRQQRLEEIVSTVIGLSSVLLAVVVVSDAGFVRLWVGAAQFGGLALAALTAGCIGVAGFQTIFGWMLDMQGDSRRHLLVSSLGAILNIVASVIFVRRWGLPGVAAGTLLAYLAGDAWYLPYLAARRYGFTLSGIWTAAGRGFGRGLPWVALMTMAAWLIPVPERWTSWFVESCGLGVAGVFYIWLWVFSGSDRVVWRGRVVSGWTAVGGRLRRHDA